MEKVVGYVVRKVVEDESDHHPAVGAALGATLDSATYKALGVPAAPAVALGAATGAATAFLSGRRKK